MTTQSHTPGPWAAEGPTGKNMREGYSQPWAVRTEPWSAATIVAGCFGDIGGDEVAEANARLIATAPDALNVAMIAEYAIGQFLDDGSNLNREGVIRAREKLNAFIAKATTA